MIKPSKSFLIYTISLLFFGSMIWFMLFQGKQLISNHIPVKSETNKPIVLSSDLPIAEKKVNIFQSFYLNFTENLKHPLSILLLQILVIIVFARFLGYLFGMIKQPVVIGEIIAGIVLGPSLIGKYFPEFSKFLFPPGSLQNLQFLSQIGLILFMFIIGMELDIKVLKRKAKTAIMISHSTIIFVYSLGVITAYFLYSNYAPPDIPFLSFALFMGISLSITAFPVLARIIQERGMTKTPLGTMALTTAASDDVTAWGILAAIIAIVKAGSINNALFTIGLLIIYILIMIFVIRPFLARIGSIYITEEIVNKTVVAFVLFILILSAYMTEIIGIHALFGAFFAGAIMPQNLSFKKIFIDKIEDISLVLLLPLFFVFTGLRTQIGLIVDPDLRILALIILVIAIIGKFGGATFFSRLYGQTWHESFILGILMNTRGLMELIVLNIGYDLGIISTEIFTILVIMALLTTFITSPGIEFINFIERKISKKQIISETTDHSYHILIAFGIPEMGSTLLRLTRLIQNTKKDNIQVTALHCTPSTEISPKDALMYESNSFRPVKKTAYEMGIEIKTIYKTIEKVSKEIIHTVNEKKIDLLFVGAAKSPFTGSQTGGIINEILEHCKNPVGVLIDRNFTKSSNILVLTYHESDNFLVRFVNDSMRNINTRITVIDLKSDQNKTLEGQKSSTGKTSDFKIASHKLLDINFLNSFDLILVSLDFWYEIEATKPDWIKNNASILILRPAL